MFPERFTFSIADVVNGWVDALVTNYGDVFRHISDTLLWAIVNLESLLRATPWWLMLAIVAGIAWHATRRLVPALVITGLLFLVGAVGLWDKLMQTLALMMFKSAARELIDIGPRQLRSDHVLEMPRADVDESPGEQAHQQKDGARDAREADDLAEHDLKPRRWLGDDGENDLALDVARQVRAREHDARDHHEHARREEGHLNGLADHVELVVRALKAAEHDDADHHQGREPEDFAADVLAEDDARKRPDAARGEAK